MKKRAPLQWHYILSIGVSLLSAFMQLRAVLDLKSGNYDDCMASFIASYLLMLVVVIYLYLSSDHFSQKSFRNNQEKITYSRIAFSLASDYESVFYLDSENGSYVEYGVGSKDDDSLTVISSGKDFYADAIKNISEKIFEGDVEEVLSVINKQRLLEAYKNHEVIHHEYRLVKDNKVLYYNLKVTEGQYPDNKFIIIGVKNVDSEKRAKLKAAQAVERSITFGQIANALASRYEVLYYIDLETDEYDEFSSSATYSKLHIGSHGKDFFGESQRNMIHDIYDEDYPMLAQMMDRDYFISMLDNLGHLSVTYRLLIDGKPEYVELRAMHPKGDPKHVIVGVININERMVREEELSRKLDNVVNMANRDALTGVKNKRAYDAMEQDINKEMSNTKKPVFAIAVCDLNNLKTVNDSQGHTAGDEYIREACRMVCRVFKHSPVYRVGGDEFVVIMRGEDYDNRKALMQELRTQVDINREEGRVVVACGMSEYLPETDWSLSDVFDRADQEMYKNKRLLKKALS